MPLPGLGSRTGTPRPLLPALFMGLEDGWRGQNRLNLSALLPGGGRGRCLRGAGPAGLPRAGGAGGRGAAAEAARALAGAEPRGRGVGGRRGMLPSGK